MKNLFTCVFFVLGVYGLAQESSYTDIGISKYMKGMYMEAISDFNIAIEYDSTNYIAYLTRGIAKHSLGDSRGAIKDYDKAISINKYFYSAHYYKGIALTNMDRYSESYDCFSISIILDDSFADAYYTRGIVSIYMNNKESGCMDLSKAGELGDTKAYKAIKDLCN